MARKHEYTDIYTERNTGKAFEPTVIGVKRIYLVANNDFFVADCKRGAYYKGNRYRKRWYANKAQADNYVKRLNEKWKTNEFKVIEYEIK